MKQDFSFLPINIFSIFFSWTKIVSFRLILFWRVYFCNFLSPVIRFVFILFTGLCRRQFHLALLFFFFLFHLQRYLAFYFGCVLFHHVFSLKSDISSRSFYFLFFYNIVFWLWFRFLFLHISFRLFIYLYIHSFIYLLFKVLFANLGLQLCFWRFKVWFIFPKFISCFQYKLI